MTAAEKAYTAEYSYVAPSVYARELAGQLGTDLDYTHFVTVQNPLIQR